jgi:voltage-gated potassium channel
MILFIVFQNVFLSMKRNLSASVMVALLVVTLCLGTFGYAYFETDSNGESKDLGTSFYWTITTITTVGYGDEVPESTGGRMVFYIVAFLGISTISFAFGTFASKLMEASLMSVNGLGSTKQKNHTILIGWDQITEATYEELVSRGEKIVVIDDDDDPVEMKAKGVEFIKGNPSENSVLRRGGIEKAKTVLIPIENDEETILIALKAKRLNPEVFVVATCDSVENQSTMVATGIDIVIPQSEIIGTLLGNAVKEWETVEFMAELLKETEGLDLESLKVGEECKASHLLKFHYQKLIAYKRNGKTQIAFEDDPELKPGDIVYYLEKRELLNQLDQMI